MGGEGGIPFAPTQGGALRALAPFESPPRAKQLARSSPHSLRSFGEGEIPFAPTQVGALRALAPFESPPRAKQLARSSPHSLRLFGEGEVRTHRPREGTSVFKTDAFDRSATSP